MKLNRQALLASDFPHIIGLVCVIVPLAVLIELNCKEYNVDVFSRNIVIIFLVAVRRDSEYCLL